VLGVYRLPIYSQPCSFQFKTLSEGRLGGLGSLK
jgi:hypothetical protein